MNLRLILTALLVPPACLLYLVAFGLVLRRRRRGIGTAVAAGALAGLVVLAIPVVGEALLVSLERGVVTRPQAGDPPQAIVILSADADRIREPPGFWVGSLTLARLLAGARLWQRSHLPVLVSGGPLRPGDVAIGTMMADTLERDFHVPVRWVEPRSQTTWENAADSAAILLPLGIRSVYVVTHAWHEPRSLFAFRHFGFIPTAAPVALDAIGGGGVLPGVEGWAHSYYALHEWIGLAVYRLRALVAGPADLPSNSAA